MKLMMIVSDPDIAQFAARSGVDRIFVDLEYLGKKERQANRDTWISRNTAEDISRVRQAIGDASLLVRLNPWYEGSAHEVGDAVARGADLLMLPMFRTVGEVESFCREVDGRVPVIPLAETAESLDILSDVAKVPGVIEVFLGLNDLHLSLGLQFMFEPLANGTVERAANVLTKASMPFGFGGLARVGEGLLPAEKIIGEHVRLGSSSAILSRTFHRQAPTVEALCQEMDFGGEVTKLRDAWRQCGLYDRDALEANRMDVRGLVNKIVRAQR